MRDRNHLRGTADPAVGYTTLRMVGVVVFPVNGTHQWYAAQSRYKGPKGIRSKLVSMDQRRFLSADDIAAPNNPAKVPLTLHWDHESGKTQALTSVFQPTRG